MLTSDKMNTTACFHIILQQDNKKYLYNLNMVAKKLFEFLCSEKGLTEEKLTLCTDEGFVLSSFPGQSIQKIVHEILAAAVLCFLISFTIRKSGTAE